MTDQLFAGLYDLLKNVGTDDLITRTGLNQNAEKISTEFSHQKLADAFSMQLSILLSEMTGSDDEKLLAQAALINDLLVHARSQVKTKSDIKAFQSPPSVLRALHQTDSVPALPHIGLGQPWLFTAGKDSPALLHELQAELASCDQVDILVSFITVSGVRKIIDILKKITSTDASGISKTRIRVLTTTYIGATEQKALDMIAGLANSEVRVSLDGRRTRLHAKAWLFQRNTSFGSAYVGSANLSGAALMGGLEWTVKFTEKNQSNLYHRAQAHFETLWEDGEFQSYDPNDPNHRLALQQAIKRESGSPFTVANTTFLDVEPKPFQIEIQEQLNTERAMGRCYNLLVAATGTGKTVMAAFDYRRSCRLEGGRPRLLFVAHRIEILRQSIHVYRQVLNDPNFGSIMDGNSQPEGFEHLFATIQTVNNRQLPLKLGQDYWHSVVIDECHHIEAAGFERLVSTIKPKILLGLTATPERGDGKSILRHFENRPDGSPAVELRLWQALDLQLLCPFEYYACDDDTDLRDIPWKRPGEVAALSNLISGNHVRAKGIIRAWQSLVSDPRLGKTLVFCVDIAHADFMAAQLTDAGVIAKVVNANTPRQERIDIPRQLAQGAIHAIVTVDLYNEGVDLPFVDTLLLLRPTQSATVFQQQIGRGLRLQEGKESCLILDFVGQHAEGFRFDLLYSSITGLSKREVLEGVENGFGRLPSGCHIQLHKQARDRILENLRKSINQSWRRLQQELISYSSLQRNKKITLTSFLKDQHLDIEDIYRRKFGDNTGWTNLRRAAGLLQELPTAEESYFSRRFESLLHIDDTERLSLIGLISEQQGKYTITDDREAISLQMLAYQIDGQHKQNGSAQKFMRRLGNSKPICAELAEISEYLLNRSQHQFGSLSGLQDTPLKLHSAYHIREILTAVGFLTADKRSPFQAGVLALEQLKTEILFVTLDKQNASHEGVAYNDYAISNQLFHWQSQNSASPGSKVGKRYLQSPDNGWTFQLFVRVNGSSPYYACGPVSLTKSQGEKPMNITWKLKTPLPMRLFQAFSILT
jgi:superfamily II DNA or RNA helicase